MATNGRPATLPAAAATGPAGLEPPAALLARAGAENFTVASPFLPRPLRRGLEAIYGFARLVDQLGDDYPGDREAALRWLAAELAAAFKGRASHPLLVALGAVARERGLSREPFARLIEANRLDQRKRRYQTFAELLSYCDLSANPVGELVLQLVGAATPERVARSNLICTALQVIEHLQDVGEDYRRGRIYLPQEDLERFGVGERELGAQRTSPSLAALIAFEADRARALLLAGEPILTGLSGFARVAVAGYLAGGHAALKRLERAGFQVLERPVAGSAKPQRAARTAALLARCAAGRLGRSPLQVCAAITRREAANFYYGIRLLDRERRLALCAVYAYARLVDDIADGELAAERKLAELAELRRRLGEALRAKQVDLGEPALAGLAIAARRFPLPHDQLYALIDGVEMDVVGRRYQTLPELLRYCEKVASSVGLLSLAIYGTLNPAASWTARAAAELGIALQLTNILRDLREDASRGRLYLPEAELARFALSPQELLDGLAGGELPPTVRPYLAALVGWLAGVAQGYFERGLSLVDQLDHRSRACVLAMAGIYRETLAAIQREPLAPLAGRISLAAPRKAGVALQALGGVPR